MVGDYRSGTGPNRNGGGARGARKGGEREPDQEGSGDAPGPQPPRLFPPAASLVWHLEPNARAASSVS
jgi:hypothetical protein